MEGIAVGQRPISYAFPGKLGDEFDVLALSNGHVVVVNFENGDLVEVDPMRSSVLLHSLSGPDVANSLAFLQGQAAT